MAQQDIYVVKLAFSAPLHLHNERADYAESLTRLHSDKIYAALMQMTGLFGFKTPIIDLESGTTTFTISSAFPYTTVGEQMVYFLPKPFKRFHRPAQTQALWEKREKDLKNIEWIDLQLYSKHLADAKGLEVQLEWLQETCKSYMSVHPLKSFLKSQLEPKVRISRVGEDSEPYYLERLFFQQGSGLYVIFKGSATDFEVFCKWMKLLGQEGIGTDRSIGNGLFTIQREENASVLAAFRSIFEVKSDHSVNLSLYLPKSSLDLEAQLDSAHAGYTLLKRGGWITTEGMNTLRKRGSYFFAEGSVFKLNAAQTHYCMGNTINLAPEVVQTRKIWRMGKALFAPIKMI
jgi:CRISPR-associated protein Csm4